MFQGIYGGKQVHPSDISAVLERSFKVGLQSILITGGNLVESKEALKLANSDSRLFCTVGVHPTRCQEFLQDEEKHLQDLFSLIEEGKDKVRAIGEFGLDYDRLEFCPKDVQKKFFEKQFFLAEKTNLPLFLHMRNAADDFLEIISKNRNRFKQGVVHSFTGTLEEARKIIELDLFIGLNGCSLKTKQNLEVVKNIPAERIMIETDAPWCDIRSTHAGFNAIKSTWETKDKKKWELGKCVKSRNEPCHLIQILEVIANCKQMDEQELANILFFNTHSVFFGNK